MKINNIEFSLLNAKIQNKEIRKAIRWIFFHVSNTLNHKVITNNMFKSMQFEHVSRHCYRT